MHTATKIRVTATGVVPLMETTEGVVGRLAVQVVTAGAATWSATFRGTLDPGQQALSATSPQMAYTPRKTGALTDGGTALSQASGADFIVDVIADGAKVGMDFSALALGGGSVTLYVRPLAG
jgi:hypothetical protein